MPTLHVRSVPDDLYDELQKQARQSNQSLSAKVVGLLARAVEERKNLRTHHKALIAIQRRRFKPGKQIPRTLDLLKEDRRR